MELAISILTYFHRGSFWIGIRQIYTYHRVNLFNCAEDLSVQLVFLYRTKEKSCFTTASDAVVIDHLWHSNS